MEVVVACATAASESAACRPCVCVWTSSGRPCQPSQNIQHSASITHVTGTNKLLLFLHCFTLW